jgi:hypothetical protein
MQLVYRYYVRKKAALCSIRIIKKVPELAEQFVEGASNLLGGGCTRVDSIAHSLESTRQCWSNDLVRDKYLPRKNASSVSLVSTLEPMK